MEAFSAGGEIWGRRSKELEALAFIQIWDDRLADRRTHRHTDTQKGFERCAMEPVFFASAPPRATTEVRAAAAAGGLATAPYAAAPPPNAHARATPRRTPADTANEETIAAGRAVPMKNT